MTILINDNTPTGEYFDSSNTKTFFSFKQENVFRGKLLCAWNKRVFWGETAQVSVLI